MRARAVPKWSRCGHLPQQRTRNVRGLGHLKHPLARAVIHKSNIWYDQYVYELARSACGTPKTYHMVYVHIYLSYRNIARCRAHHVYITKAKEEYSTAKGLRKYAFADARALCAEPRVMIKLFTL